MGVFRCLGNARFEPGRQRARGAVGSAIERQAVCVVAQPVERGRGQQPVGRERLIPLGEVQVAGDEGGGGLVALGDEVVQVLVGGRAQGFEAEVIDDEQRHARQAGELAFVGAGGLMSNVGLKI